MYFLALLLTLRAKESGQFLLLRGGPDAFVPLLKALRDKDTPSCEEYITAALLQSNQQHALVRLTCFGKTGDPPGATLQLPQVNCDMLLERVFSLPGEEEMRVFDPRAREQKLSVTVLDGLLTALFTTPGPRVLSVNDLVGKQLLEAEALQKGLYKVAKKINRWKAFARRATKGKKVDWLSDVLRDYHPEHPASPTLALGKYERDINVLMTLDPSFCFSVRSELSLGWMTEKTQVAVRGTRYAGLLAFIGASRFLRAQRLSGALVNCYVPVARNFSIDADTSLPLLLPTDCRPDQAALWHWLALSQHSSQPKTVWNGLAYQTLLTQGQQQSLSLESGVLETGWLIVTEFRSDQLAWDEIVPGDGTPRTQALRLDVYVWPMITDYRHGTEKLLVRSPLFKSVQ